MQWYVHSSDGTDYRVGTYLDGEWIPGSREDAEREWRGLDEPGSYFWAKRLRVVVASSSL